MVGGARPTGRSGRVVLLAVLLLAQPAMVQACRKKVYRVEAWRSAMVAVVLVPEKRS